MDKREDKPMPDIGFKMMTLLFKIRDRFRQPENELQKVGINEGQTVLDFGCGPGSYTIAAASIVGEKGQVYALDIHPLAIKAVEHKAKKRHMTNITTILSDRETGLPEKSVDVTLLYDTIHMITDKLALIEELHRVMKPNGLLSIWVGHMKTEDVLHTVEKEGLFSLKEQQDKLLNFERRTPS